jgi:hypothetical protein
VESLLSGILCQNVNSTKTMELQQKLSSE